MNFYPLGVGNKPQLPFQFAKLYYPGFFAPVDGALITPVLSNLYLGLFMNVSIHEQLHSRSMLMADLGMVTSIEFRILDAI